MEYRIKTKKLVLGTLVQIRVRDCELRSKWLREQP